MEQLENEVAPALMMSPAGLAGIGAGVLGFCLVSLTFTHFVCPGDVRRAH